MEGHVMLINYTLNMRDADRPRNREKKRTVTVVIADNRLMNKFNPNALASIIADNELMIKYDIHFEDDDDNLCFPLIIIRKNVFDIATKEELEALITHEMGHWIKKHRESPTREIANEQHKELESIISKDNRCIIDNLSERVLLTYGKNWNMPEFFDETFSNNKTEKGSKESKK